MKDFEHYSDRDLLNEIKSGDDRAMDFLLNRYGGLVRRESRKFFLAGADEEDLIQEGMIGLFKAVKNYDDEKNASFYICITLCKTADLYDGDGFQEKETRSIEQLYLTV